MTMTPIAETLSMLAGFLFTYLLLFVGIPMLVLRFDPQDGWLDKVFISLTHSTLFFIVAIHLLVGIRLLETISLLVFTLIVIWFFYVRYSKMSSKPLGLELMMAFFDLFEREGLLLEKLLSFFRSLRRSIVSGFRKTLANLRRNKVVALGYLLVFGAVAIDRFRYPFIHLNFPMPDPYTHLGWSKYMSSMKMYVDGVYPYGFEAVVNALYQLFRLDMYAVFRFIGPVTTILIMLSLVYALKSIANKNHLTILLTLALFGFSADIMLHEPNILMRQMSGLSMEYTAVFLFPGIVFFYRYFKTDRPLYLLLAAETYCITAFSHPFVTVTMTIAYLAMGIAFLPKLLKQKKMLLKIVGYMGVAGATGIAPMVIGLLAGQKFHGSSVDYMEGKLDVGGLMHEALTPTAFAEQQPLVVLMLAIFLAFTVGLLLSFALFRKNNPLSNRNYQPLIMSGIFVIGMIIILLNRYLGLPTTVPYDRQPVFLSMSVAFFFGVYWQYLFQWIKNVHLRNAVQFIVSLAIVFSIFAVPGLRQAERTSLLLIQYDEGMRGYLDIKEQFPYNQWTIVSPVDELGVIWGYGYHGELWEFVRDLEDPEIQTIKFTTPYVFVYAEKIPMDLVGLADFRPVTLEEARAEYPQLADGQPPTEFYYWYNMTNRRILMSKTYYWAEAYMSQRSDMEVFLETDRFKIYKIDQGSNEVIIDKRGVSGW